jgi:hypothetical protein
LHVCKTKKNRARNLNLGPWDRACKLVLLRSDPIGIYAGELERGVNYFVLMLEQLGANTHYSCEGHPDGFYILFEAPFKLALKLRACGFFKVELEGKNLWSLRTQPLQDETERTQFLRTAASQWETKLGPLQALAAN